MTDKHTTGPWSINWGHKYSVNAGGRHIAMVSCFLSTPSCQAENEANARLIAAAPELLAALVALLPMVAEWHAEFPRHIGDKELPAIQAARDAIAKAEGGAA